MQWKRKGVKFIVQFVMIIHIFFLSTVTATDANNFLDLSVLKKISNKLYSRMYVFQEFRVSFFCM